MKKELKKKKDWFPIILYITGSIIISFIITFILLIIKGNPENITSTDTITIEFFSLLFLFIAFILKYKKKLTKDFKNINKKTIKITIGATILIVILNIIISEIIMSSKIEMTNQEMIIDGIKSAKLLTCITTIILAPLVEEIVFRYSIETITKNKIAFIIISSILFAIMHGIGIVSLIYMILGAGFSIIYIKTDKNIIAPTIAHCINNIISVIGLLI